MSDALVEQGPTARFFCHRCNIEFEDVLQDYTCPYCASGFIELLENVEERQEISGQNFSDADMSSIDDMNNFEDSEDSQPTMFNDLAHFLSTYVDEVRDRLARVTRSPRADVGLTVQGARPEVRVTAGETPSFVLFGAQGDFVLGEDDVEAFLSQLLGQHAGPPPLPRDQLEALPSENVSSEQAAANTSCPICWENFMEGESASRLVCDHVFHLACIRPWLQLHATCPICRRFPLPDQPPPPAQPQAAPGAAVTAVTFTRLTSSLSGFLLGIDRLQGGRSPVLRTGFGRVSSSSSGSTSTTSSVPTGGVWAPRSTTNSTGSTSSTSLNSSNDRERQYNMDIEYD